MAALIKKNVFEKFFAVDNFRSIVPLYHIKVKTCSSLRMSYSAAPERDLGPSFRTVRIYSLGSLFYHICKTRFV